jgi:hypothetical protein
VTRVSHFFARIGFITIFSFVCSAAFAQNFVNCDTPVVCVLPAVTFSQAVGTTSPGQNITAYNGTASNVTINSVSSNLSQFKVVSGATPTTLAPGQSETFTITFTPDSAKSFAGKLTFYMTGVANQVVNATGTGLNAGAVPSLSVSSLNFGNQALGTSGPTQNLVITNNGTASVKLTGVTVTSPFSQTGWTATTSIGAGKSLTLKVSYTPRDLGSSTGTIYLTYDVAPSNGIALWGTGVNATVLGINTFRALPTATQSSPYQANLTAAGGTAPYTWTLASGSTLPSGLTLSSAGVITGTLASTVGVQQFPFSATVTDAANATSTAAFTLSVAKATGANCASTTFKGSSGTPLVPINDLGTNLYNKAESGGLYANGSNTDDFAHDSFGQSLAAGIQPLDSDGNPSSTGKYVLLGIGLSITQQSLLQFVSMANADPAKNPNLVVVNGATGGATARDLTSLTNNAFWEVVTNDYLPNAGVTPNQVVAVFFMDLDGGPNGTFPKDMTLLQSQYESIMRNLVTLFPNVKMTYLSSVYYMGYSAGLPMKLDPDPWAYEAGFAVKNAIQDQINGVGNLNFDPAAGSVVAPWMAWGPYLWANGLNPRSDGLVWTCQDVQADGTHPSNPAGRIKVSTQLLNFLKTDATAAPWFLAPGAKPPEEPEE